MDLTQIVLIGVIIGLALIVAGLLVVNSRLRMKDDPFKKRHGLY